MIPENPLLKRIKRHVIGRIRSFFVVTAPGLEKLCFEELMALPLSVKDAAVVAGGVEFKGRVHDCYLANLNLRTASRILMRIGEFKATNFRQLEKKLSDFSWEIFLYPGLVTKISVVSRHSRLYHKSAITDQFKTAIANRLAQTRVHGEIETGSPFSQHLFIRVVDDRFTVSLDSSGEILYKRGIKKHGGKAPIRETIAAAALKLAGYTCTDPLMDPMCGSGTFSIEAAMMAQNIPPGWFRNFAFMGWPCFRHQRWAHIRRESEKYFFPVNTHLIYASDKDKKACHALEKRIKQYNLSGIIKVFCKDFFDLSPAELTDQAGLVIINPPYGLRIGTRQESDALFYAICDKLKKEYNGWKLALVLPHKKLAKNIPFNLTTFPLFHGGLKLVLMTGRIT